MNNKMKDLIALLIFFSLFIFFYPVQVLAGLCTGNIIRIINPSESSLGTPVNASDDTGANLTGVCIEDSTIPVNINADISLRVTNGILGTNLKGIFNYRNHANFILTSNIYIYANGSGQEVKGVEGGFVKFFNYGILKIDNLGGKNTTALYVKWNAEEVNNYGSILVNGGGDNPISEGLAGLNSVVNKFNNYGLFSITSKGQNSSISVGVGIGGASIGVIRNFYNSGIFKIHSEAQQSAEAYGIKQITYFMNPSDDISQINDGDFTVSAVTTASGSTATAYGIYTEVFTEEIYNKFQNNKNFYVSATSGQNVNAYGVYFNIKDPLTLDFYNNGSMTITAKSSSSTPSVEVYGLKIDRDTSSSPSLSATIVNRGDMKLAVTLPDNANTSNVKAHVFHFTNAPNITLSNYGNAWVESNVSDGDYRILYLENGSGVILQDKFAVTFGAPGVNPNKRPFYVDSSSTLNLNGTRLIARIDSRNLKFLEPYYLIENNGGTVTGQWRGLEKGFSNPLITVNWLNPSELGENSAVVFGYNPTADKEFTLSPLTAATAGNLLITGEFHQVLAYQLPFTSPYLLLTKKNSQPVMYASTAVSDTDYVATIENKIQPNKSLWLMPVYTKVKDRGIGFNADLYGIAVGFGRMLTDSLSMDVYGGYVKNNLHYRIKGADNADVKTIVGGLAFMYRFPEKYHLRYNGEIHRANNKYRGRTGADFDLSETADYNSWGVYSELLGGKVFETGKFTFVPEIGWGYGYYKTSDFWTKVSEAPSFEKYYKPDTLNIWKAIVSLGTLTKLSKNMELYGLMRLEQAIGDNNMSTSHRIRGDLTEYKIDKDIANTDLSADMGIKIKLTKNLNLTTAIKADFNSDYNSYSGRMQLKYLF